MRSDQRNPQTWWNGWSARLSSRRLPCRCIAPLLWEFVAGQLDENRLESVERHLAQCARCRREVAGLRQVHTLLQNVQECPAPDPCTGWEALRQRLVTETATPLAPPTAWEQARARRVHRRTRRPLTAWMPAVAPALNISLFLLTAALGWRILRLPHPAAPTPVASVPPAITGPVLSLPVAPSSFTESVGPPSASEAAWQTSAAPFSTYWNQVSVGNWTGLKPRTMRAKPDSAPEQESDTNGANTPQGSSLRVPYREQTQSGRETSSLTVPPSHSPRNGAERAGTVARKPAARAVFKHYVPQPGDQLSDVAIRHYAIEQVQPANPMPSVLPLDTLHPESDGDRTHHRPDAMPPNY